MVGKLYLSESVVGLQDLLSFFLILYSLRSYCETKTMTIVLQCQYVDENRGLDVVEEEELWPSPNENVVSVKGTITNNICNEFL